MPLAGISAIELPDELPAGALPKESAAPQTVWPE